jgi:KDO2-lipid IV(A) lauroyltransferase
MSHGLEYLAFWSLTRLVQLLPARAADWLAVGLGQLAHMILKSRREIAYENLRRGFRGSKGSDEIESITRKVFISISRTSIEFCRFPVLTGKRIVTMIPEYTGLEYLEQIQNEGRGAILVSGHIGNWELLGAWVYAMGYQIDFLVGQQHNQYVDNLLNQFRKSVGVGIIPIGVAARHVIKSLKANRLVAMVSDQHSATGGTDIRFFDRPASTPKGPAAFAVKMNCPILSGFLYRKRFDIHKAVIFPPIYPPDSGDREKDIIKMTQAYTSGFENAIREYPDQWMWTHRRWKRD